MDLIDNPRQKGAGHYKKTGKYAFLSKLLNLEKESQNPKKRKLETEAGTSGEGLILPGDINGL